MVYLILGSGRIMGMVYLILGSGPALLMVCLGSCTLRADRDLRGEAKRLGVGLTRDETRRFRLAGRLDEVERSLAPKTGPLNVRRMIMIVVFISDSFRLRLTTALSVKGPTPVPGLQQFHGQRATNFAGAGKISRLSDVLWILVESPSEKPRISQSQVGNQVLRYHVVKLH